MPPVEDAPASTLAGLLAGLRLALWGADGDGDVGVLARVSDWDGLAALAAWHQVAGLLLRGIRRLPHGLPSPAADQAVERLQAERDRAVHAGMRQVAALHRSAAALAARDIPCLVIKGVPLAQRLYGDAFARDALDIDLWVPPEAAVAAGAALVESGFRLRLDFPETPARRRWYRRVEKAETFRGHGVIIELHQRLLANPCLIDGRFEPLFERRTEVRIGAAGFPALAPVDEALYLLCHGAGHGWRRLKWLCDAALRLHGLAPAERPQAAVRAREAGIEAIWGSTLIACGEALGLALSPAPDESAGTRRSAMIAAALPDLWRTGRWPPLWRKVPQRLAMKPSLRFALHELSRLMVETDDWRRVNLPDSLFYLYFLLRPLLWAKDALAGTPGR